MKTYRRKNHNLFKSIKTAYSKRVASKIEVADWQLEVMVPGTEPARTLGEANGCIDEFYFNISMNLEIS